MARTAQASVWIDAAPEAIWEVVADLRRSGEWSGESRGGEWLNGAAEAGPGSRFKGRNKRRGMRWSRVSEVISADRPRELVWRTLPSGIYPDSTEWRVRLEPEAGGTRVTEEMRILHLPRAMEIGLYCLMPVHHDRSADIAGDLARLKTLVERRSAPGQHETAWEVTTMQQIYPATPGSKTVNHVQEGEA